MIKVRMGVKNTDYGQSQRARFVQNALRRPARVDNDRVLGDRIANDGTIASEGRDRKGFSDHAVPLIK